MDYLRRVFTKRQRINLYISAGVLVIFFVILFIGVGLSKKQDAQKAAQRWSDSGDYAQVSVYFSELMGASENTVKEIDFNVDSKLDNDSLVEENPNARRRISAYSALGEVDISTGNSSAKLKAVGVGGDFFLFHPYELVNGNYFTEDNPNKDQVLIDEEAAWTLFGSNDVCGQVVEISGKRHVVSGVYKRDTGRLNKLAGNDVSTVYLSFESLKNYGRITYLNCYEVLTLNPLTGYVRDALKESIPGKDESKFTVVENTGRFHWTGLLKNGFKYAERSMNSKAVVYPFWENMARGMEDILTPLVFVDLLLILYVFVNLAILFIRMWHNRTIHKADIINFLNKKLEEYRKNRKKKLEEGDLI